MVQTSSCGELASSNTLRFRFTRYEVFDDVGRDTAKTVLAASDLEPTSALGPRKAKEMRHVGSG